MTSSKDRMQSWAMKRIDEACPPADALGAIDDLYRVEQFFKGRTPLLFGMKTVPDAFEDPGALVERARAGLLQWFEHLGKTGDESGQAKLYETVRVFAPMVAEPEIVRRQRAAALAHERARQAALTGIPRPMQAVRQVSASLATGLENLRDARPNDFFETHGARLTAACGLKRFAVSLDHFEWDQELGEPLDPEWDGLVDAGFDPPFFPFAGGDGDYIGVLVAGGSNDTPVTIYSHEEGYREIAPSLATWIGLCDGAKTEVARGRQRPARIEHARTAYDAAFEAARAALASLRRR